MRSRLFVVVYFGPRYLLYVSSKKTDTIFQAFLEELFHLHVTFVCGRLCTAGVKVVATCFCTSWRLRAFTHCRRHSCRQPLFLFLHVAASSGVCALQASKLSPISIFFVHFPSALECFFVFLFLHVVASSGVHALQASKLSPFAFRHVVASAGVRVLQASKLSPNLFCFFFFSCMS